MQINYLFIDRDGTLLVEPADKQIDCFSKFSLLPNVIPSLLRLQSAGYTLVMVSNQDGLGTSSFPEKDFWPIQNLLLDILKTQGIHFTAVHICEHFAEQACACRKPKIGLLADYLIEQRINRAKSYVIGDRASDIELATNLGIQGLHYHPENFGWQAIADYLLNHDRKASVVRTTNETEIHVAVNLDRLANNSITTGIGFFDHMLDQLAKHGGFHLELAAEGDLHIDEHHTVEDIALTLGAALRQALGNKRGVQRYGFVLPMDESLCQVAIDLAGRSYCKIEASFTRDKIGEFPTECSRHFFHSLSQAMGMALHITVQGQDNHHIQESMYKCVGRTLRQAMQRVGYELPTTKGVL